MIFRCEPARPRDSVGNRRSFIPSFDLRINGATHKVTVRDPDEPLLYVLRNRLGLTGAKYGCGVGQCGACTITMDGEAQRSCLVPVKKAAGHAIVTVEGLGTPAKPSPLQQAFIDLQAAQCGYCVAGMVMTATALLARHPDASEDAIRAALAGNLCRCGTHQRILKAVLRATGTTTA
jgi:nicotinate dehydrogenase subunit A